MNSWPGWLLGCRGPPGATVTRNGSAFLWMKLAASDSYWYSTLRATEAPLPLRVRL